MSTFLPPIKRPFCLFMKMGYYFRTNWSEVHEESSLASF